MLHFAKIICLIELIKAARSAVERERETRRDCDKERGRGLQQGVSCLSVVVVVVVVLVVLVVYYNNEHEELIGYPQSK